LTPTLISLRIYKRNFLREVRSRVCAWGK